MEKDHGTLAQMVKSDLGPIRWLKWSSQTLGLNPALFFFAICVPLDKSFILLSPMSSFEKMRIIIEFI